MLDANAIEALNRQLRKAIKTKGMDLPRFGGHLISVASGAAGRVAFVPKASQQFKQGAVALALGRTAVREIAEEFGIAAVLRYARPSASQANRYPVAIGRVPTE